MMDQLRILHYIFIFNQPYKHRFFVYYLYCMGMYVLDQVYSPKN